MKKIIAFTSTFFLFSCGSKDEIHPKLDTIKELVFASGTLEWDHAYNLTAQTDGVLTNVSFEIGTHVQVNQIIANIDNPTNANNSISNQQLTTITKMNVTASSPTLQQIKQNIQFAESKYEQDIKQANRYKRLYESQSVAKVEYENMRLAAENSLSQWNTLKKQYEQVLQQARQNDINAENQLKNSRVQLNYNQIKVPQEGTVIKKLKETGDYVKKGDIIAVIADAKKMECVLNVDENSIAKIKIGQPVFIQLNTNKQKVFEGKISEILTAYDDKTQSFICKALFNQSLPNSLYGTQLEANILIGEKKNALLIPRKYLGFGNKVKVKGKEAAVLVKTGIVSTEYVEILSGLSSEDIIVPLVP